jgi:hypothetical protein
LNIGNLAFNCKFERFFFDVKDFLIEK